MKRILRMEKLFLVKKKKTLNKNVKLFKLFVFVLFGAFKTFFMFFFASGILNKQTFCDF